MPTLAWFVFAVVSVVLAASQPQEKEVVVLLADPDGKVGQVEVATTGGRLLLAEANQMTKVADAAAPPSAAVTVDHAYMQSHFAEALAAQPQPPLKFRLYFLSGSTELDAASAALVPEIIAAVKTRDSRDIGIHGHSDTVGKAEDNIELSLRRAVTVKQIILDAGLSVTHLEITSHGEGNPLVPTADEVAEPRNRRVEVVVR